MASMASAAPPPAYPPPDSLASSGRPVSRDSFESQTSSLPGYDEATATAEPGLSSSEAAFIATAAFQIQTSGKSWFSLPGAPMPADPIPVYAVSPAAPAAVADTASLVIPKYVSLRRSRGSGNCVLIHGASFPEASTDWNEVPVIATTQYRFGFNKPPQLRLYPDDSGPSSHAAFEAMSASRKEGTTTDETWALDAAGAGDAPVYELQSPATSKTAFTASVNPVSFRSRAVRFATPLGTFQWRYGARSERKLFEAHSLLILERLVRIAPAYPSGSADDASTTLRVPVGYFIRSGDTRSPGTSRSTAGNGGRLLLDLRAWESTEPAFNAAEGSDRVVDDKRRLMAAEQAGSEALEAMERVAIISCLCVLKKEVDRRRVHQAFAWTGAVGGCP